MNSNVVNMIEELLKDNSMSPYDVINNYSIRKELNKIFEGLDSITISEIKYFTNNRNVQNAIVLYLYEEGIELLGNSSYVTGIGKSDLDTLALYFKDMRNIPLLSAEEEKQLFIQLKNTKELDERERIKEKIIKANLRLVVKYATLNQNRGLSIQDLIQEGNIGLMIAIDKFDVTKGYKFSTYATQWIRQKINNGIIDKSRIIKYPSHIFNDLQKLNKLKINYYKETGTFLSIRNDATKEEIAKKMNIKKESLEKLLNLPTTISLETPVNIHDNPHVNELMDFIPDESNDSTKEVMKQKEKEEIRELLFDKTITERERVILIKRYGLYDSDPVKLEDLANEFGLSIERIRQIQRKAEAKVKDCSIKKGLSNIRR